MQQIVFTRPADHSTIGVLPDGDLLTLVLSIQFVKPRFPVWIATDPTYFQTPVVCEGYIVDANASFIPQKNKAVMAIHNDFVQSPVIPDNITILREKLYALGIPHSSV